MRALLVGGPRDGEVVEVKGVDAVEPPQYVFQFSMRHESDPVYTYDLVGCDDGQYVYLMRALGN